MVEHADVFAIATEYQANGLRDLVAINFTKAVKEFWSCAEFSQAVQTVYHSIADDIMQLRAIVADAILEHFGDHTFKDDIEAVVSSIPGLAYSHFKRSREKPSFSCGKKEHTESQTERIYCVGCNYKAMICSSCFNDRTTFAFCWNCGVQFTRRA